MSLLTKITASFHWICFQLALCSCLIVDTWRTGFILPQASPLELCSWLQMLQFPAVGLKPMVPVGPALCLSAVWWQEARGREAGQTHPCILRNWRPARALLKSPATCHLSSDFHPSNSIFSFQIFQRESLLIRIIVPVLELFALGPILKEIY